MNLNNIWIYGVGGVGGVIGGKIALFLEHEKDSKAHLFFIARGKHLKEIQAHGLILNTADRQGFICKPTLATDNPEDLPSPDLCFICVKSYDLDNVSKSLVTLIKPETVIIPLLNGVDIYERIRKFLSSGIILPACMYVGTHIEKPGTVAQKGGEGKILFGKDPEHPDFYPEEILTFLKKVHIPFQWFDDSSSAIWEKFVFIAGFGLVSAYSKATLGQIMENPKLTTMAGNIMQEIHLIAKKKNISLPSNIVEVSLQKAQNFPYETKTSYQRDLEQQGKPNEGDLFGSTIIRLGKEFGIPTPFTELMYNKIISTSS